MRREQRILERAGPGLWTVAAAEGAAEYLLAMDRDWALDILLWTERSGTIGHMVGGFLYDEPALGLEENEINEGIRIFCFLTRSAEDTAGYGEALATRFLSVDRSRELYSRWRAYARWHAYANTLPCYDWVSDSTSDDCGKPTPLVHLAPQPMMPGQHSAMRVLRTTPPEGVLKVG